MRIPRTIASLISLFVAAIVVHSFHRVFTVHAWVLPTVFPYVLFELVWNFFVSVFYSFVVLGTLSFALMVPEYLE